MDGAAIVSGVLFYSVVCDCADRFAAANGGRAPTGFFRGTLYPAVSVCFFFCLLTIFAVIDHRFPLIENLRFLGHLFFIG